MGLFFSSKKNDYSAYRAKQVEAKNKHHNEMILRTLNDAECSPWPTLYEEMIEKMIKSANDDLRIENAAFSMTVEVSRKYTDFKKRLSEKKQADIRKKDEEQKRKEQREIAEKEQEKTNRENYNRLCKAVEEIYYSSDEYQDNSDDDLSNDTLIDDGELSFSDRLKGISDRQIALGKNDDVFHREAKSIIHYLSDLASNYFEEGKEGLITTLEERGFVDNNSQNNIMYYSHSFYQRYTTKSLNPELSFLDKDNIVEFIGIKKNAYSLAKPTGKGTVICLYHDKIFKIFFDILNKLCSTENIEVTYKLLIVNGVLSDKTYNYYDLPYTLLREQELHNVGGSLVFCFQCKIPDEYSLERRIAEENKRIAEKSKQTARDLLDKATNEIMDSLDKENDFDSMDGHEFEYFCAELLTKNGYTNVEVTSGSGDQGVDILAYKHRIKFGIQCKCYSTDIGNSAVQEVIAGKSYYNCSIGVVLTNRYFTKSAITLAEKAGIVLWDREMLLELIDATKKE